MDPVAGTSQIQLIDLPKEILSKIFGSLDVQSRIRCESVCRNLRDVVKSIYSIEPWDDVPRTKSTFVISAWCCWIDMFEKYKNVEVDEDGRVMIRILERGLGDGTEHLGLKRRSEWFAHLLASIMGKFIDYVGPLEIHNASLNSYALETLLSYRSRIHSLTLHHCIFDQVTVGDVMRFRSEFGDKLQALGDCDCLYRHQQVIRRMKAAQRQDTSESDGDSSK